MDELVHAVRSIRAEMQLPPSAITDVFICGDITDPNFKCAKQNKSILEGLVKINTLSFTDTKPETTFSAESIVSTLKIVIPLPQEMREKEKQRLSKELEKLGTQSVSLKEKLSNTEFCQKAPAEVIQKLSGQLSVMEKQIQEIEIKLKSL